MTSSSLGTAASGGGGNFFTLLASFNMTIEDRRLTGSSAAGAADARNQEKAGDPDGPAGSGQEPEVVAMAASAPPPPPPLKVQEPVNKKRGHDFDGERIWAIKKQRSSIAAAPGSGNSIAGAMAAATPSPVVQGLADNRGGGNPICKKSHHLPWGSVGVLMDEKTEEKLHPCVFGAPDYGSDSLRQDWKVTVLDIAKRDHHHNGEEAIWLIKRSCTATVAVCEGSNGAVDQNRAISSAPSTVTQDPTRRSSPRQESNKAAGRRSRKSHKTPLRPFMSLTSGLQCLGVTEVTPVLARTLTVSDSCLDQSRLQFSTREVMNSPLMSILTQEEYRSVHKLNEDDGLDLKAIDRHGYSYSMKFKYVKSSQTYRLMQEWVPFLTQNSLRAGDMVEVGAFRVDGRPMLMLLNYATEGWIPEETEAAGGLLMLSDLKARL